MDEALSKENIWHQWMLDELVNIEMPTRNTLAHMYDAATSKLQKKNLIHAFNSNTPSSSLIMWVERVNLLIFEPCHLARSS